MIATTSSAAKAEKLKKLGADHIINYKDDPKWGESARKLTPEGYGVDHIIEVGGQGTLAQSFKAIKYEGVISVIGFLGGGKDEDQPTILDTLSNICTVRGVYVGSKELMKDMIRAIEANDIHPVVDEKVFTLDQARKAYDFMVSAPFICHLRFVLTVCVVGPRPHRQVDHQDQLSVGNNGIPPLNRREGRWKYQKGLEKI